MRKTALVLAMVAGLLVGASQAQAALVTNGNFETGDLSGWTVNSTTSSGQGYWFAYTGTVAPLTGIPLASTVAAPPQGTYAALTDQISAGRRVLHQDVAVPQVASGASVTLSLFAYYKAQQGNLSTPSPETLDPNAPGLNEQYRIDVMKPSAALGSVAPADVLLNVFQTQTGDPTTLAPTTVTADLTPFAGQTVRLRFAEVDNNGVLNASTDDVQIRVQPTLSTAASQTGNQIVDSATLGGAAPTGQIAFSLYGPDDPTCTGSPIFSSTKQVSGNGDYSSDEFTPSQPGTYRWVASYSGDIDHEAVAGACSDPGESVEFRGRPTLSTTAAGTGDQLVDSATLASGAAPTGQIAFSLYGPDDPTCTGSPIFSSTKQVSGNGDYPSDAFRATQPGAYRWVAAYSGDSGNEAVAGACGDPGETVEVPETTIGSFPKNPKRARTHFRFRSSIGGSTFTCQLDQDKPKSCRSPSNYRDLEPGRHKFKVFATSPQGVVDPTPAKARFRISDSQ